MTYVQQSIPWLSCAYILQFRASGWKKNTSSCYFIDAVSVDLIITGEFFLYKECSAPWPSIWWIPLSTWRFINTEDNPRPVDHSRHKRSHSEKTEMSSDCPKVTPFISSGTELGVLCLPTPESHHTLERSPRKTAERFSDAQQWTLGQSRCLF